MDSGKSYKVTSKSAEETKLFAEKLARGLPKNSLICLYGDLGAGKTTFVKGIGKAFGIDEKQIKSPTFVYLRTYHGAREKLHHFDCYRISKPEDLELIFVEILAAEDGTIILEWAQNIIDFLPEKRIDIFFEHLTPNSRTITIHGKNS